MASFFAMQKRRKLADVLNRADTVAPSRRFKSRRPDMVDVLRRCVKEPKDRRRTSFLPEAWQTLELSRYRCRKGYEAWHARRC